MQTLHLKVSPRTPKHYYRLKGAAEVWGPLPNPRLSPLPKPSRRADGCSTACAHKPTFTLLGGAGQARGHVKHQDHVTV